MYTYRHIQYSCLLPFNCCPRVTSQVSQVVLLFQTCGVGTHTCLKALATIRKLVGDIETTTTLLSSTPALQLPAAEQGEGFGQYRWVHPDVWVFVKNTHKYSTIFSFHPIVHKYGCIFMSSKDK